jgi:hypothetical protein
MQLQGYILQDVCTSILLAYSKQLHKNQCCGTGAGAGEAATFCWSRSRSFFGLAPAPFHLQIIVIFFIYCTKWFSSFYLKTKYFKFHRKQAEKIPWHLKKSKPDFLPVKPHCPKRI